MNMIAAIALDIFHVLTFTHSGQNQPKTYNAQARVVILLFLATSLLRWTYIGGLPEIWSALSIFGIIGTLVITVRPPAALLVMLCTIGINCMILGNSLYLEKAIPNTLFFFWQTIAVIVALTRYIRAKS